MTMYTLTNRDTAKNKSLLTEYHEYMTLYHQPDTNDCLSYYKIDHANDRAE